MNQIRAALTARRRARDLTQQQIADAAGVSRAQVSNFESGRVWLSAQALLAYAEAVELTLVDPEEIRNEERHRFRSHVISDPTMRALHECAKEYSLAVQALQKVEGTPLSTTLAFLIEQGYLVSARPPRRHWGEPQEDYQTRLDAFREAVLTVAGEET